jgi:hypothetical protein
MVEVPFQAGMDCTLDSVGVTVPDGAVWGQQVTLPSHMSSPVAAPEIFSELKHEYG